MKETDKTSESDKATRPRHRYPVNGRSMRDRCVEKIDLRDELNTLRAVRDWLRREAVHTSGIALDDMKGRAFFDMSVTCTDTHQRGIIACIGGYAWLCENPGDFNGANAYGPV